MGGEAGRRAGRRQSGRGAVAPDRQREAGAAARETHSGQLAAGQVAVHVSGLTMW